MAQFVFGKTRVCIHTTCETVFHNCNPKDTKCLNCGSRIHKVNFDTFVKKYQQFPWQVDYQTEDMMFLEEGRQTDLFDNN